MKYAKIRNDSGEFRKFEYYTTPGSPAQVVSLQPGEEGLIPEAYCGRVLRNRAPGVVRVEDVVVEKPAPTDLETVLQRAGITAEQLVAIVAAASASPDRLVPTEEKTPPAPQPKVTPPPPQVKTKDGPKKLDFSQIGKKKGK